MKLEIKTTKGTTRNYNLSQTATGVDCYRIGGGFFSSSQTFIGHGHDVAAGVLICRIDAGDHLVRSIHLHN